MIMTVEDLIKALQQLPPDAKLGHWSVMDHEDRPPKYPHIRLFVRNLNGETWVYTTYDNESAEREGRLLIPKEKI